MELKSLTTKEKVLRDVIESFFDNSSVEQLKCSSTSDVVFTRIFPLKKREQLNLVYVKKHYYEIYKKYADTVKGAVKMVMKINRFDTAFEEEGKILNFIFFVYFVPKLLS